MKELVVQLLKKMQVFGQSDGIIEVSGDGKKMGPFDWTNRMN